MPFNSVGFNTTGFNATQQATGGGGTTQPGATVDAVLPLARLNAHTLNHLDTRTYTNVIGKAYVDRTPLGGLNLVDVATELPTPIPRVVDYVESRIGYGVLGYAKVTGTVVAGSVASASCVMPSVITDGLWLAMGKGYADTVLPSVTVSALGAGGASVTLPSLTVSANLSSVTFLDAAITLPSLTVSANLLVGNVINTVCRVSVGTQATADSPVVANAALTINGLAVSAGLLIDGNATVTATSPSITATAYGGGHSDISTKSCTAKATATAGATATSSCSVSIASSGTCLSGNVATATANIRLVTRTSVTRGVVATFVPAQIRITSRATALSGTVSNVNVAHGIQLVSACVVGTTATASADIGLSLASYCRTVTGATVWRCVNLRTGAVTDWDIAADYIAGYRGKAVVTVSGGVSNLSGDTDNGAVINYNVVTGIDDLGTDRMKRIADVWLGGRNLANVTLTTDGRIRRELAGGLRLVGATERRVKVPRGIKTRYVQLGIYGEAPASLDAVSIEPEVLSRRVR